MARRLRIPVAALACLALLTLAGRLGAPSGAHANRHPE